MKAYQFFIRSCFVGIFLGGFVTHAQAQEPKENAKLCQQADACGSVQGVLKSAGTRIPVEDAQILLTDVRPPRSFEDPEQAAVPRWILRANPNSKGEFSFIDVPHGTVWLIVIAPGFARFERSIVVDEPAKKPMKFFLQPTEQTTYRTVVTTKKQTRIPPSSQVLSQEEIATIPGAQGDPLRALQNLPGVARAPGGLGVLIMRGADPNQSQVFLGEHPIPRAFHVFSLSSVFPADISNEIVYSPGNFDSAYGNATGGLVVVKPRTGRRNGIHGHGEIDLGAASALVEGPIRKGSFIIAAQRGYIDALLLGARSVIGGVTGENLATFALPSYYDYQGIFTLPTDSQQGNLTFRVFGSGDRIRYQRSRQDSESIDPSLEDSIRSDFHRFDVVYRKRLGPWEFLLTPAFRYDLSKLVDVKNDLERTRRDYITFWRAEASRRVTKNFTWWVGTDGNVDRFHSKVATLSNALVIQEEKVRETEASLGFYTSADLRLGPVLVSPSVRANVFTVRKKMAFAFDPRVNIRYSPHRRWQIKGGVGLYSQPRTLFASGDLNLIQGGSSQSLGGIISLPPIFSQFEPRVALGTQEGSLTVRRAVHTSAGVEHTFNYGISVDITGFLRWQDNAVPPVIKGANATRPSQTRNLGLEVLVRKQLHRNLYGWLAYTLMKSDELVVKGQPLVEPRTYPSDFDQRHNLVALLSYKLPKNWRIGTRFRLTSGFPYTPVVGTIKNPIYSVGYPEQKYGAFFSETNSARLPLFHQLDIRVDKQWILKRTMVNVYFDVQNVYNRLNVEAIFYSFDYRDTEEFLGLPIFPSLGLRVDY